MDFIDYLIGILIIFVVLPFWLVEALKNGGGKK